MGKKCNPAPALLNRYGYPPGVYTISTHLIKANKFQKLYTPFISYYKIETNTEFKSSELNIAWFRPLIIYLESRLICHCPFWIVKPFHSQISLATPLGSTLLCTRLTFFRPLSLQIAVVVALSSGIRIKWGTCTDIVNWALTGNGHHIPQTDAIKRIPFATKDIIFWGWRLLRVLLTFLDVGGHSCGATVPLFLEVITGPVLPGHVAWVCVSRRI